MGINYKYIKKHFNTSALIDSKSNKFFEEKNSLLYKVIELLISQIVDKVFLSLFNHFTSFVKQEIAIIINEAEEDETLINQIVEDKENITFVTDLYENM